MVDDGLSAFVERGDPERWRTVMVAPEESQQGLQALYAFNLEIARVPWVASEEILAEIRLRWWSDAIDEIFNGHSLRRHQILEPLSRVIGEADLPRAIFHEMIDARMFDARRKPHSDQASFESYINQTSGHLMVLAAKHMRAGEGALPVVREFARGAGVAAFLRSLPEFMRRGQLPLSDQVDLASVSRSGLEAIARARVNRSAVPKSALAALLPGWMASRRLELAAAEPDLITSGVMEVSEFRSRGRLFWVAATGRW